MLKKNIADIYKRSTTVVGNTIELTLDYFENILLLSRYIYYKYLLYIQDFTILHFKIEFRILNFISVVGNQDQETNVF